jgi:hypothetical protein
VDPTTILPNIIRYCLSEGEASLLPLNDQFMMARFRPHQIIPFIEFASTELRRSLSAWSVARAFGISHSAMTRAKLEDCEDPQVRGRHCELDREPENWRNSAKHRWELNAHFGVKASKKFSNDQLLGHGREFRKPGAFI